MGVFYKFGTCLAAVILAGGVSTAASALTLKVADSHNSSHSTVIALKEMGHAISKRTNGQVKFKVFANGVLGTEAQAINQLRTGILDIVRTSPADLEKFNPTYSAFLLPYLFKDVSATDKAMAVIKDDVFQSHPETGFMGLTWNIANPRSFYTVNKQIKTPDDLKGLKIRVPNSHSMAQAVEMLGATPTPVPWSESYTAIQQGIVDGAEGSPTALIDSKQVEIVKYFSFDRHFIIPDMVIISKKTWDKLTDQQKQIFKEEADVYTKKVEQLESKKVDGAIAESKKHGIVFTDVDIEPFKARVKPLYDAIAENNPEAAAIVAKIEKAQE